jgi:hypothetical protein
MTREPTTDGEIASPPKMSSVVRIPFDSQATDRIAEALDVEASRAPFQLPGATVWQILVPGANERPAALVTLCPSLRRVDVVAGPAAIVFTDVIVADLVPLTEVQFRRRNNDYLIVARGGKVVVRA